ncbi:hypothetical protein F441_00332 [Phytophthora nicotianae CJ01A1]|uniref:Uncharacterized protein n=1 Tax=Phytophthora nicotianae CJ01A1 TaxID=1317063 RepID=W2XWN0_PHYNI|nr:hypothetical protein F441_00332 [Phytophthora nicotianae CJ01A1]
MLRHLSPPTPPSGELPTPDETSASARSSSAELCDIVPLSQASAALDEGSIQLAQDTVAIEPAPTQASTVADASEQDSDEPDDSNDEDWSDADEASEEDEVLTGESEVEEEAVEEAEDISINLIEVDVRQLVTDFIRDDACERRCLEGKAGELEHLVHKNIRPYVPEEFQSNPIYAAPSKEQGEDAKAANQARREHRAAMAVAAKATLNRCGRDAENAGHPVQKKLRK